MSVRNMDAMAASRRAPWPPAILPVAFACLLLFGFGPNMLLALVAVLVLVAGSSLLWRPGESPILLFIFGYQWMQASARIFHANVLGVDVADLSYAGGQVAVASLLSLVALLVLAVGLRIGTGPWRATHGHLCRAMVLTRGTKSWFQLYVVAWAAAAAALIMARYVPGLGQPLLAAATLKWAFFWILAYATFVRPEADRKYLIMAFVFEFALSMGGYFSGFKTVFFMTILAMAAAGTRMTGQRLAALAILSGLLFAVAVVWTAVKFDYRHFVSGGERAQIVTVGYGTRVATLVDMVANLETEDLRDAVEETVDRISYVDFFAVVLDTVPEAIPHENGALWWDAISRPFMPRILFRAKSAINDSERTNYYTGLGVAGSDHGTSISIGYVGESYIDFGALGMMAAMFLYGLFLGRVYRWFVIGPRVRGLLGMACMSAILIGASALESSITKVMGGLIVSMLVAYLLARLVVPTYLPWLMAGKARYRLQIV